MTPAVSEIEKFRWLVSRRLGLAFDDSRLDFLSEALLGRLEARGCESARPYLARLERSSEWGEEWRALADRLTVSETYFFRYWDHFRAFADVVLPGPGDSPRELRILSAGCASGEEPYSLAMLALDRFRGVIANTILGIDASPSMIDKARRARYSAWSLRETPPGLRTAYFQAQGREFILADSVRSLVKFEERNLVDDDPSFWRPESFDVVFCRNVTMYLSPDVARSVVGRIGDSLRPGGYLFLGHAETLRGVSEEFHLRHTHNAFYYQKRLANEKPGARFPQEPTAPSPKDFVSQPWPIELNTSWIDAIQRASDRIAALFSRRAAGRNSGSSQSTPRDEAATRSRATPDLTLAEALEFVRREKFSEAMAVMRELPVESTSDPDALLLRAALLMITGDLDRAQEACRQLLELDELNAGAHYLAALCREHAGDAAGAMEHDQAAVYLDPGFAMPRLHLGIMARRSGELEAARRHLADSMILLEREDGLRILLFGGGFSRNALINLCKNEIRACGETA